MHEPVIPMILIAMNAAPDETAAVETCKVSLREAVEQRSSLPSLATLKRMSAAGLLGEAVAGRTDSRYPTTLYDLERLVDICNVRRQATSTGWAKNARGTLPSYPATRIQAGTPPTSAAGPGLPVPSVPLTPSAPQAIAAADLQKVLELVVALQDQVKVLAGEVEGLNTARRALQLKYDAENHALRQKHDEQALELRTLRSAGSALDGALILKKLNLIGSKLGL